MYRLPIAVLIALAACGGETTEPARPAPQATQDEAQKTPEVKGPDKALVEQAKATFKPLPEYAAKDGNKASDAMIDLGRMLYFEKRLSKNQEIACASCHDLEKFGVDNNPASPGHKGQLGGRNSPTSLNAALHVAQFWDGRAEDVEAQAKGPILNPVEMAMADEASTVAVLKSIPGYAEPFKAAFPDAADPITYDNMATAIGAFERGLMTPGPLDKFLAGDDAALTEAQLAGMKTFLDTGCQTCHLGVAVGGASYHKLGQVNPYETADEGRIAVTGNEADKQVFKAPSLRNIAKTGPYFHDGSIATLDEAVKLMAHHQLGKDLSDDEIKSIVTFLDALTGEVDATYAKAPALPESGPQTPAPVLD